MFRSKYKELADRVQHLEDRMFVTSKDANNALFHALVDRKRLELLLKHLNLEEHSEPARKILRKKRP